MKKFLLFFTLFLLNFVHAQKLENALLWKISGNGLTAPSYLFGTIHASCEINLDANVTTALNETQQTYLEIDLDDPTLQMTVIANMKMKNNQSMYALVTEEDGKLLDQFLKENAGVSLSLVSNYKPFFVNSLLLPKLLDCEMKSVENELVYRSAEKNKEVFGLETVKEQMDIFDAIPYKDQMADLVKTAKNNFQEDKREFRELLALYESKDINKMAAKAHPSDKSIVAKFEDKLLISRNRNWIPRIRKAMLEKATFFGIGAAHLGGENGVITLLRKEGFTLEAIDQHILLPSRKNKE